MDELSHWMELYRELFALQDMQDWGSVQLWEIYHGNIPFNYQTIATEFRRRGGI
jgi:hypothetical protein